jgi:hypothetical protein
LINLQYVQCVDLIQKIIQSLKKPVYLYVMTDYEEFCVSEALHHINMAREILTDGLKDPKKYHDETKETYKVMAKLFPLMILLQHNGLQLPDQGMEESLSDTLSSTQSDSGSFEPVTPSDQSGL